MRVVHLLELVGDHGEGFEDGVGRPSDGDDAFGTVPLGDVDAGAALSAVKTREEDDRQKKVDALTATC